LYFDEPAGQLDPMRNELRAVLAVTGLFTIFFFVYPGPLVSVRHGRGEVAVLDDIRARSTGHIGGLPSNGL